MEHKQRVWLVCFCTFLWVIYQCYLHEENIHYYRESRLRMENNVLLHLLRRRCAASRNRRRRWALMGALSAHHILTRHYRRCIREIWVYPRTKSWWPHISSTWTDHEWLLNFRMRRGTFSQLCDALRPWLTRQNTRYRKPVPVEVRVAVCVWRLATNLEYRSLSHLFGLGLSTCCVITQEVVTVINAILKPQYIKTPSAAEFRLIAQGFRDKWRFPQVAGAIDGTHINIRAPSVAPADYYNRKGHYSIILQGVVDHRLKFWDINVGRPGRIHDARVFALSGLYERGNSGTLLPRMTETFEGVDVPLVILGDSAYPLLSWLMKPYREVRGVTQEQIGFNHRLSQARMTVERAFGRLKGRWRCLLKLCDAHISLVSQIVSACCVLHNFCEVHNEQFLDGDTVMEENEDNSGMDLRQDPQVDNERANEIRNALCRYFSRL